MPDKIVRSFQIIDHGVENSQYFQGCGVVYTRFQDVATGIGDSPFEALEDALESLAQAGWNVEAVKNDLSKDSDFSEPEDCEEGEESEPSECWNYVSVRVSEETED